MGSMTSRMFRLDKDEYFAGPNGVDGPMHLNLNQIVYVWKLPNNVGRFKLSDGSTFGITESTTERLMQALDS